LRNINGFHDNRLFKFNVIFVSNIVLNSELIKTAVLQSLAAFFANCRTFTAGVACLATWLD
jgi:hypothetical protein